MKYKYVNPTGTTHEMEDYKISYTLSRLGSGWTRDPTARELCRGPHQTWAPWTLRALCKVKVFTFLFGLTAMFLITASYILMRTQRGPLPALSARNFGPLARPVVLSRKDCAVLQKVEIQQRVVPDISELKEQEPHIFSVIPRQFLPPLKNPCWYEEYTGGPAADPYGGNLYVLHSKRLRAQHQHLNTAFQAHLRRHGGVRLRLRCLPYFYVIGQPKCGTTDLYDCLRLHPQVQFTTMKEPHWWTRKRFGIIRLNEGLRSPYPLEDYLDLFDQAAYQIQDQLLDSSSRGQIGMDIIIGEASASTMWDNNAWVYFYDDGTGVEPPYLVQDFIHAVQPNAKFIVMLRDPVERLYSDYLYFGMANKTVEDFHERVCESLQLFEACLSQRPVRSCVYNSTLNSAMPVRLQVGLYVVYLLDWLSVFSPEQILVLRLEDHAANRNHTIHRVLSFLHLEPLTQQKEADITRSPASNARNPANRNLGPMLPITKEILQNFYGPFNQQLAVLLDDSSFLWTRL
ncbi:carbohydrate sulfotransferase 15 [Brachyhypopomus gauderio]|uniref:carbohydrate sulfotransferase 15 n=1 Tax=Brachyhypopomus gauderio TaxID=698409 RepID=UPI0040415575